ncbi:hypothetical protein Mapa_005928 [Marchantia paleacea]|nr:hypothetical protein Mapa_005928 [Marchantia paleacea]
MVGAYKRSIAFAGCRSRSNSLEVEKWLAPVPVTIVTKASQLPPAFLHPDGKNPLIVGFDCEGVNLARYGRLCIMQLAFEDAVYLVDAVEGGYELMQACKPALESIHITKVVHDCKRDSELKLSFAHPGGKVRKVCGADTSVALPSLFHFNKWTSSFLLCSQIAYTLLEEQQGKKWVPDDYISFVDLLSDERYCGAVSFTL